MDTNMLKSVLVKNGDNVAALADKMGLSQAALYRRINGDTDFDAYRAQPIEVDARDFQVTRDDKRFS